MWNKNKRMVRELEGDRKTNESTTRSRSTRWPIAVAIQKDDKGTWEENRLCGLYINKQAHDVAVCFLFRVLWKPGSISDLMPFYNRHLSSKWS